VVLDKKNGHGERKNNACAGEGQQQNTALLCKKVYKI
jgi:hypothetical protein